MCILSSCNPLFASWSAFSFYGILVWADIQLRVGICGNLDAASLMALVIIFKSSFLLFCMFTDAKGSVCIVSVSLVSLASSSATRMAVISASSIDAESLSLMIIYSPWCTTSAAATHAPSLEPSYSTCCRLVEN